MGQEGEAAVEQQCGPCSVPCGGQPGGNQPV